MEGERQGGGATDTEGRREGGNERTDKLEVRGKRGGREEVKVTGRGSYKY